MEHEINIDGQLQPVADGFLQRIKNTILQEYFPVSKFEEGVIFMTTNEVYKKIQRLYPDAPIAESEVALWLHEKGYTFFDAGEMRFEWMLKPSTQT